MSLVLVLTLTVTATELKQAQVVRVIDGDTIEVKMQGGLIDKVRYIGIDTPETHHSEKPVEYFGFKASEFNKELVRGKKVKLEYDVNKKTSMAGYWPTFT